MTDEKLAEKVGKAMVDAPHDGKPWRQARAAIAAIRSLMERPSDDPNAFGDVLAMRRENAELRAEVGRLNDRIRSAAPAPGKTAGEARYRHVRDVEDALRCGTVWAESGAPSLNVPEESAAILATELRRLRAELESRKVQNIADAEAIVHFGHDVVALRTELEKTQLERDELDDEVKKEIASLRAELAEARRLTDLARSHTEAWKTEWHAATERAEKAEAALLLAEQLLRSWWAGGKPLEGTHRWIRDLTMDAGTGETAKRSPPWCKCPESKQGTADQERAHKKASCLDEDIVVKEVP